MKKLFLLATAILALVSCTAFAASGVYGTTKVVIVGGAEFKTNDYYKSIQKALAKSSNNYDCGNEIQRRYQLFMMERYDIGENRPRKQDLIDFAAQNGYGNVLFLIVNENIDTQNNAKRRQKNRSTIQLDAYLANGSRIIDFTTTAQDFTSKTSNLRARRGAFEKCLKEVADKLRL